MSETTEHHHGYDPAVIEPKWREAWKEASIYKVEDESDKPNWMSLTMYPYPSGVLHVGHWYAFSAPDVFARSKRMRGFNVMYPMGFDAFGLPAENAAIKHNIHPAEWTYDNINTMIHEFDLMGAMIDWDRKVVTCDPEYYHWNQWLFLQMYEKGLAYRSHGAVWWCPKDQTVLANEQVIEGNICERCGSEVYKRDLDQWYYRITEYAQQLLDGLDTVDWPDRVKSMQRNWIGRSEGARLKFELEIGKSLEVFTTRPDTVFGATFMVLAPEHPFVDELTTPEQRAAVDAYVKEARTKTEIERQSTDEARQKSGVFTGGYAINPVNDERIPVWIADYVLMSYGTGAIMAVPSGDQRDFEFARHFDLPVIPTVQPEGADPVDGATMTEPYVGDGTIVNSGQFNGMKQSEALPKMIEWLDEQGRGSAEINWRLRDWLISRQRYWGTPIPIVYCDDCGTVPVPEDQLPVKLPLDAEFKPTGQSPLITHEEFVNTTCPTCGKAARRETDTMDTFMDSSWYWFRYASPSFADGPFDREKAADWNPVDLYTGGIEHAILHLLYARFITRVLRDLGETDVSEPFTRLRNQGMILSEDGRKMSKSRGAQIGPTDLVDAHGADALRLHLMFLGPWEQGGPWNDRGITGMERFIKRAFQVVTELGTTPAGERAPKADEDALISLQHQTIKRVTDHIDSFSFNTMVAAKIEFVNELMKLKETSIVTSPVWREAVETLVLLMAPSTPYVAEEMWQMLGNEFSVHQQPWPEYDPELAVEASIEIPVQINGKVRDRIMVPSAATADEQAEIAKASEKIASQLEGKQIVKEISVPGRMVNLVVK